MFASVFTDLVEWNWQRRRLYQYRSFVKYRPCTHYKSRPKKFYGMMASVHLQKEFMKKARNIFCYAQTFGIGWCDAGQVYLLML